MDCDKCLSGRGLSIALVSLLCCLVTLSAIIKGYPSTIKIGGSAVSVPFQAKVRVTTHTSTPCTRQQSTVWDTIGRLSDLVILDNNGYFSYVAVAVHNVFTQLHINHTVAGSIPEGSNATFILFTTHEGSKLPKNYISYNFEQLTTDKQWPPELFERLRGAQMVWDYSLENIKVLRAHNITNVYHVPLGYDETMDNTLPPAPSRDLDVVFVGALNDRRQAKLQQLTTVQRPPPGQGPVQVSTAGAWGNELLQLYRRSKLALNLHYYGGRTILEVHRIIPLIASQVLVLSERSDDAWLDSAFTGIVNFTTGDDIRQSVSDMLTMDVERETMRRYHKLLRCCLYASYFKTALAQAYPAL